MPTYDLFTFFNELDVLDIRLREMSPAVDMFVIAESPVTFQGRPKPLHFADNRHRFRRYASRIRHLVIEDMPDTPDPWLRERHQRDALRRGLHDAPPDSLVLVSDVDEVVRPAAIAAAQARRSFTYLQQALYLYYLNWYAQPWVKAYAAPLPVIRAMADLNAPRFGEPLDYLAGIGLDAGAILPEAGWHFSWLGGVDRMLAKLDAFSHTEREVQRWRDPRKLLEEVAQRRFFNDGVPLTPVDVATGFPVAVARRTHHFERLGLLSPGTAVGGAVGALRERLGEMLPGRWRARRAMF